MVNQCFYFKQFTKIKNLGIRSAKRVAEELDSRDGGIETLLGGPPLVGIFSLDPENLDLGKA